MSTSAMQWREAALELRRHADDMDARAAEIEGLNSAADNARLRLEKQSLQEQVAALLTERAGLHLIRSAVEKIAGDYRTPVATATELRRALGHPNAEAGTAAERCHRHHKIEPDERGRTCCCTQPSCPATGLQRATEQQRNLAKYEAEHEHDAYPACTGCRHSGEAHRKGCPNAAKSMGDR